MNKHVFIVEDNPDNGRLISWIMEDIGYTSDLFEDAESALDTLDEKVDLVLMDISLPGMNGKEAIHQIRQGDHKALPIIAITAHELEDEVAAILASGANEIIHKPVDENILITTVRALCE